VLESLQRKIQFRGCVQHWPVLVSIEMADKDRSPACVGCAELTRSSAAPGQGRGETSVHPLVHVQGREQPPPGMSCMQGAGVSPSPSPSANLQRGQSSAVESRYLPPDTRHDPVCWPKFSPSFLRSARLLLCFCCVNASLLGWVVSDILLSVTVESNIITVGKDL